MIPTWLGILFAAIGAAGTVYGVLMAYQNNKKSDAKDIKSNAAEDAELRADIKYIARGVEDIRVDIKAQEKRHGELTERVAKVEEVAKSAHKRIDTIVKSKEE